MLEDIIHSPVNVLLVEDGSSDAEVIRTCLEENDFGSSNFQVTHVTTLTNALLKLEESNINVVMLDLFLPDSEGLEGLSYIQNAQPDVPVLILTGRDDESLALKAVEKGAQDYLIKDKINAAMLQRSACYALQRKRFQNGIIYRANYDPMTGLANRQLFEDRLEIAVARQQRSNKTMGLLLLDLNGFKEINDTYGHAAGDMVLIEIGGRIPQCLRPYDMAARLGGDEFVILIEGVEQSYDCSVIAQKLIDRIACPIDLGGQTVSVGVSIGIATCGKDQHMTGQNLLGHADEAMYYAKDEGKSSYRFYAGNISQFTRTKSDESNPALIAVKH